MDPVPDLLLLRKSGSAGNRTRDLCICSQKLWPLEPWRWLKSTVYLTAVINASDFCSWKFYCTTFIWFCLWLMFINRRDIECRQIQTPIEFSYSAEADSHSHTQETPVNPCSLSEPRCALLLSHQPATREVLNKCSVYSHVTVPACVITAYECGGIVLLWIGCKYMITFTDGKTFVGKYSC